MAYTVTRDFSAPAQVVFGIATDLRRWGRWLPDDFRLEQPRADEIRVEWSGGAQSVRCRMAPDDLQVTAGPADRRWTAELWVREGAAGGSTVRLEVRGVGGPEQAAAERAVAHLDDEVSENLNTG